MEVVTVGGVTIDTVVAGARWSDHGGSAKQDVKTITTGIGGGAVNSSLAFREFGAGVRIVGAVGDDPQGVLIRTKLSSEGIDTKYLQTIIDAPTGQAVIHLDDQAEARVFAARGASAGVSPARAVDAFHGIHLLYVTALSAQAEGELDALLCEKSKDPRRIVVNPGLRQIRDARPALVSLLRRADLLCFNRVEAVAWAEHLRLAPRFSRGVEAWITELALHAQQSVLVTLGERGACFYDEGCVFWIEALPIKICSTLGAGDAFNASTAYHWAMGRGADDALAAARLFCSRVLCLPGANCASLQANRCKTDVRLS